MKAWRILCIGIEGIVRASNRGQARWHTIRAARDAGYDVPFTAMVHVRRAPLYDDLPIDGCVTLETARCIAAGVKP